jgi:hypothetical protein
MTAYDGVRWAAVTNEGPDDASCIVWAFGMFFLYIIIKIR